MLLFANTYFRIFDMCHSIVQSCHTLGGVFAYAGVPVDHTSSGRGAGGAESSASAPLCQGFRRALTPAPPDGPPGRFEGRAGGGWSPSSSRKAVSVAVKIRLESEDGEAPAGGHRRPLGAQRSVIGRLGSTVMPSSQFEILAFEPRPSVDRTTTI